MSFQSVNRISFPQQAQQNNTPEPQYSPDDIIIKFSDGVIFDPGSLQTSSPQLNGILKSLNVHGAEKLHKSKPKKNNNADKVGIDRIFRLKVPRGADIRRIIQELRTDPGVEYAEPNYLVQACATPDDTLYPQQWGLAKINAPAAWNITTGSNLLVIAVLDTGLDRSHPDFAGNIWVNPGEIPGNGIDDDGNGYIDDIYGWNFAQNNNNPMDDNSHGTYVAGIAGAATNNALGFAGLNWNVKLMGLKNLDSNGTADMATSAAAMTYAADNGADVINCSWGGYGFSSALRDAVNYARMADCVVVGAAGNDPLGVPFYPAAYHGAISVGATDQADQRASFSNYGYFLKLVAPGTDVVSLTPGGGFAPLPGTSGTSNSAAFVSGLAALIRANNPGYTTDQIYQKMATTAVDLGTPGWDRFHGHGRINAFDALQGNDPMTSFMTSPSEESAVSGTVNINGSSNGPNFQNYAVEWGVGEIPTTWSTIGVTLANGGTVAVNNNLLATFDTSLVPAGQPFTIRLTSRNTNGEVFYDEIRLNRNTSTIITGTVNDGSASDIDYQVSIDTISANWNGFMDPTPGISTISEYQYKVGTSQYGDDITGTGVWKSAGLNNNFTLTGLSLAQGQKYYTTVRTINNKGESVDVCSDGVTVDTTAPSGAVSDGTAADIDYQTSATSLAAHWSAADTESGIANFQYSIGTTSGGTQLMSWTDAGLATSFNLNGLSLVDGQTYYTNVRAMNGAGTTTIVTSNGVRIITSSLTAPSYVNDGTAADIDYQTGLNGLSANWAPVPYASKYWYAVGATPDTTNLEWIDNGASTSMNRQLQLLNGQRYYISVRAENVLGVPGAVRTSDGLVAGDLDFKSYCYPSPYSLSKSRSPMKVHLKMPVEGNVTVRIFDTAGNLYKELLNNVPMSAGIHEDIEWDGRGREGQRFTERAYFCAVIIKNSSGREIYRKVIPIVVER